MKNITLMLTILLFSIFPLAAETQATNDTVYQLIENGPKYEGGQYALMHFIGENLQIPEDAIKPCAQQKIRVVCSFIIEIDGSISDATVVRSSGIESVDREALRVVGLLDKWNPAIMNNEPVRYRYYLPIRFIQESEPPLHEHISQHKYHDFHHELYDHTPITDQKGDYIFVDKMPEYRGGKRAFGKYMADNLHFPQSDSTEHRVICQFIVKKDGKITDVNVKQSCGNTEFDNEAVRVLSDMPNWLPGRQNGKKVDVKFTLPVIFKK